MRICVAYNMATQQMFWKEMWPNCGFHKDCEISWRPHQPLVCLVGFWLFESVRLQKDKRVTYILTFYKASGYIFHVRCAAMLRNSAFSTKCWLIYQYISYHNKFPGYQKQICLNNGKGLCLLWGTDWIVT